MDTRLSCVKKSKYSADIVRFNLKQSLCSKPIMPGSVGFEARAAERGGRGGNLPQGLRYSGAPNARSQCSNGPGWGPLPDRYAPGLNLSLGGPV